MIKSQSDQVAKWPVTQVRVRIRKSMRGPVRAERHFAWKDCHEACGSVRVPQPGCINVLTNWLYKVECRGHRTPALGFLRRHS